MEKEISPKKYIALFAGGTAILCVAAMFFMYLADPWLYYRIKGENRYWLDGAYVSAGLIRNKEYDTAVIGSSYFQDFRMEWFRKKLGEEPVNLTVPGLDLYETALLSKAVVQEGKAERQIICLTYYNFEEEIKQKERIPEYLLDDNKWNDMKYLTAYEAWVKFLPLDIATFLADRISPSILDQYSSMMDPDKLGNEMKRFTYSEESLMNAFHIPQEESREVIEEAAVKMKKHFEEFYKLMDFSEDTDYIFVLPPHSALYWYYLEKEGKLDAFFALENYIVEKFEEMDNVTIIDAQTIPEIVDLNHYRDTTHFDLVIQEKIVDLIEDGKSVLDVSGTEEKQQKLRSLIQGFKERYGVE